MPPSLPTPSYRPPGPILTSVGYGQAGYRWARQAALREDDGAVIGHQYPVFEVPPNGLSEDAALDLAPDAHQIFHSVAMSNVGNILVDYGAGVEVLGDVVRSGTDDLYTTLVGSAVGVGPDEGWEKGVVDIDYTVWVGIHEPRGEDLHVSGKNNKIYLVLGEQVEHRGFLLGFGLFGYG